MRVKSNGREKYPKKVQNGSNSAAAPLKKQHMPTTEEILHLVGLIYACATDAGKQNEVLRVFNAQVGGSAAHIFTRHLASGAVLHSQTSATLRDEANEEYVSHWGLLDPRAQLLASRPAGQVLRCQEHFTDTFVAGNSFYQDYFIPHGFRWSLGGMFQSGPGTATVIAGMRAPDAAPFEESAAATLCQLLPHFERAAAITSRLEQQSVAVQSATDMLKVLPTPCLFTDQVGRCIEGNEAFSQSLEPLSLHLVTGRVRFTDPALQSRWETALFETQATALAQTMLMSTPSGKAWKLHLIPWQPIVQRPDAFDKRLILVVFDERIAEAQPQPGSMASRARLTRAEVEVLAGLLKGLPAKTIASRRSASVHTVRSQIMAILDKTGYNSQRELIASFGASSLPDSAFVGSTFQ
jgi:DNA-binding CsgD family transcriptional regulator